MSSNYAAINLGLYTLFYKGQGHQGIFSLVIVTLWGNCKFLLEPFKGTNAKTRGHTGKLPLLPTWSIIPSKTKTLLFIKQSLKLYWNIFLISPFHSELTNIVLASFLFPIRPGWRRISSRRQKPKQCTGNCSVIFISMYVWYWFRLWWTDIPRQNMQLVYSKNNKQVQSQECIHVAKSFTSRWLMLQAIWIGHHRATCNLSIKRERRFPTPD